MNTELSRPWFAHYDSFVPRTSEVWNKPLYALLDEAANQLRQDGIAVETVLLESGTERVSEQIARQVETSACDLVILGTHGRRGVDRLLLGSDAEQVARIATVPVMLVRQPRRDVGPARSAAAV